MSSGNLWVHFLNRPFEDGEVSENSNHRVLPFAASQMFFGSIKHVRKLSEGNDVKTVYNLGLDVENVNYNDYMPGDTIAILPSNDEATVEKLLIRLNIEATADKPCQIRLTEEGARKKTGIPKHIPPKSTLREIFLRNVDIRSPPRKLFLKTLLKHTTDAEERETLIRVCTPKGSDEYVQLICGSGRTLAGLLDTFSSSRPPVEMLLELLPPLLPRPYSISSSPLQKNVLDITFDIITNKDGSKGLCSGWLEKVATTNHAIPFYFRQPNDFRLTGLTDKPTSVILVATGTGIAPFRALLQHRLLQIRAGSNVDSQVWLFYGCRFCDKDYLYKDEMEEYLKSGALTRLDVAFSRDGDQKYYVQHHIEKNAEEVVRWILNDGAEVFVCGNSRTMVGDVRGVFIKCFVNSSGMSESEAENYVNKLQKMKRYNVDSWW